VLSEFEMKLKSLVEQLVIGDPTNPNVHVGPLANQQMVDDVNKQINESVEKGAKILCGGEIEDNTGYYYPPTIITNTTFDMPVCNQETFGPIFAIIGVEDAFEAIKVANDSIYGLGANLFTNDTEKAQNDIAPKIEAGAVFINGPVKSDPRLPFGGIKKSGYGRELSHYGIKEFVNIKTVWLK
jgi:succinate-semialdehyde dehydrogenase/glutarate-semialdehyde dehydrogenase